MKFLFLILLFSTAWASETELEFRKTLSEFVTLFNRGFTELCQEKAIGNHTRWATVTMGLKEDPASPAFSLTLKHEDKPATPPHHVTYGGQAQGKLEVQKNRKGILYIHRSRDGFFNYKITTGIGHRFRSRFFSFTKFFLDGQEVYDLSCGFDVP